MTRWRWTATLAGCAMALATGALPAKGNNDPDSGPDVGLARQLGITAPERIQSATRARPDNVLRVAIDRQGVLYLPPGVRDLDMLLERLAGRGQDRPSLPVRLIVDQSARLAPVAMLLDQCDTYGLTGVELFLTADASLPVSATAGKPDMHVRLTLDGSIRMDQSQLDARQLAAAVQAASPDLVEIHADARCTVDQWAHAVDQLRTAGAKAVRTTAAIKALDLRTRVQPGFGLPGEQTPAASAARFRAAHTRALSERLATAHDHALAMLLVRNEQSRAAKLDPDQLPAVELPDRDLNGPVCLAEIHQRCCRIEQAAAEIVRQVLAIRTAQQDGLALREALKFHQRPVRIHPPLPDAEILADGTRIENKQDYRRFTTALGILWHRNRAVAERTEQMAQSLPSPSQANPDAKDAEMIGYKGPELMPDEITLSSQLPMDPAWFKKLRHCRRLVGKELVGHRCLDSWFLLGPLPASPSDVRQKVAPPAVQPDLAGRWRGKDDKPVAWQYRRQPKRTGSQAYRIEPARVETFATYYAKTQIVSDRAREIWMAFGADDYGALWINGELTWLSVAKPRPYNALENLQLVQLRKGVNEVLFRFTNVGGTTSFSVILVDPRTAQDDE